MLDQKHWTMRPIKDIDSTAEEMNWMCGRGKCPVVVDAVSMCPVMELCGKPCAEIGKEDWMKWLRFYAYA